MRGQRDQWQLCITCENHLGRRFFNPSNVGAKTQIWQADRQRIDITQKKSLMQTIFESFQCKDTPNMAERETENKYHP